MSHKLSVRLTGISKKYVLHHDKPTLIENILFRRNREEFWALKDINLKVVRGERIGIVGPNGSGKTTLLKIIAGITSPSSGKVSTSGKLVSLIELDSGLHPELSGEENIFLNSLLVGMSKKEVKDRLGEIISFADIGGFIFAPLYTYSRGMRLRLGFSIVVHTNPQIGLLDENMTVGDKEFMVKSQKKIREFIQKGKTLIIVSHWTDFLKEYCNKIVWMDKGRIIKMGRIDLIQEYLR